MGQQTCNSPPPWLNRQQGFETVPQQNIVPATLASPCPANLGEVGKDRFHEVSELGINRLDDIGGSHRADSCRGLRDPERRTSLPRLC